MNTATNHSGIKRIAVFGGSGATGRAVLRQALARGIRVRTLVRDRASLESWLEGVEVVQGLFEPQEVDATLEGAGAAICVFGPRPPYTDVFCAEATATVIAAMKRNSIERLVCQTGSMIGEYPENRTFPFRMMVSLFDRRLPSVAHDRAQQESRVKASGLSWTIVKPPRIVDREPRGKIVAGAAMRLGLISAVTRADLAAFLIDEALSPRHEGNAVFVRN